LALATAKLRTKDSRSSTVSPRRRRRYSPTERLAILQYRAARGESLEQTVQRFVVTAVTISSWHRRVDEQGRDSLVKLPQSVNKCPEAVTYLVRRLRVLCPTLGRRKIATMLTRAGFT
jgi:transposase-like protein